jgi:hypothetical protein
LLLLQLLTTTRRAFVALQYDLESIPVSRVNFSASVNVRNMWETYLPVFHACVVKAKGAHVMCSYNSINGVPTCGDPQLLNGILRDQWKWPGFVVSDYDAWANIKDTHYYCPDYVCAAAVGYVHQLGLSLSLSHSLSLSLSVSQSLSLCVCVDGFVVC